MHRLDKLAKIQLATGTINYLSVIADDVRRNSILMLDQGPTFKERHKSLEATIDKSIEDLTKVMLDLNSIVVGHDVGTGLDSLILDPAFQVLCEGKDDHNRTVWDQETNDRPEFN